MSEKLTIRENRIYNMNLMRTYRLLHITDAHLLHMDENETPERAAYAQPRIDRVFCQDGITSAERFGMLLDYIKEKSAQEELDGVIFTGDILDFPSEANLRFFRESLESLKIPYVYTLGNHDWSYFDDYHTPKSKILNRPRFAEFTGGNTYIHKKHIGEICVIALDNTLDGYEDGVFEAFEEAIRGEENVLVVQHIPFYAETLHDDTVKVWRRDLCIGGEGFKINGNWKKIYDLIVSDASPVMAVITGHLHFWHEDLLDGGIPQYVTSQSAFGNAQEFVIGG